MQLFAGIIGGQFYSSCPVPRRAPLSTYIALPGSAQYTSSIVLSFLIPKSISALVAHKLLPPSPFALQPIAQALLAYCFSQCGALYFCLLAGRFLKGGLFYHLVGFKDYDSQMPPRNAAVSWNPQHAVTGVSPNFTIDYARVENSRGKLDVAGNPQVAITAAARLDLAGLHLQATAMRLEQTKLLLYCATKAKTNLFP